MLNEILQFLQTNITHIGYWIVIAIFGFVVNSIVKNLSRERKGIISRLIEEKKEKKDSKETQEEPTQEKEIMTPEEIDGVFPEEIAKGR